MKIKVNGNYYINFNDFSLQSSLDSVASSFSFTSMYDSKNSQHREFFRPLSYHKVEFFNDAGILFFTGTIVNHKFNSTENPELVTISGYSTPGILEDCSIPRSAYPLEHNGMTLAEICRRVLKPFNIDLKVYPSVTKEANMTYAKSVAEPSESVKEYLSKLASQRNVIISHDRHGNLVLFKPDRNAKPIRSYHVGNTSNISLDVDGQGLHSDVTILRQPSKNSTGLTAQDSISNPMIKVFRPATQKMTSGEETDTKLGVENYMADELKNIKVKVALNRWDGMMSGDIVELEDEEIYINKKTRFMVESTTINETAEGRTMSIDLVLPETFGGGTPKNIFL